MREIELTQGYTAIVDGEDCERVASYNWNCKSKLGKSARRFIKIDGKATSQTLGQFLLNFPSTALVGHVNGDPLDYRKSNLRLVNQSQLQAGNKKRQGTSSKYKGVSWDKRRGLWVAKIRHKGIRTEIGGFKDEDEAARAYDAVALELHGEYARLNLPAKPVPIHDHSPLPSLSVRKPKGKYTSAFIGVYWDNTKKRWGAMIEVKGKSHSLGTFKNEHDAALARDRAAKLMLGARARLNFPTTQQPHEPAPAGF